MPFPRRRIWKEEADDDCGSDGCELDPLCKRALAILAAGVED